MTRHAGRQIASDSSSTDSATQNATSAAQCALVAVVRFYRYFLSPWLGSACRFEPTCSAYALQALAERGAAEGSYLVGKRLLRCHPWCAGGPDPLPARADALVHLEKTPS